LAQATCSQVVLARLTLRASVSFSYFIKLGFEKAMAKLLTFALGGILLQCSSLQATGMSACGATSKVEEPHAPIDAEQWTSAEESGVHLLQKRSQAVEGVGSSVVGHKGEPDPSKAVEQPDKKTACEMDWWNTAQKNEGELSNEHYLTRGWYTSAFGLTKEWYDGKHMLDVGCGPRGSLQWADKAASRTCVDPLALEYGEHMGVGEKHDMRYVYAGVESMPFPDKSFDVVTSVNNFDHVENVKKGMSELIRVLRPGGSLIMIVEIHAHPTACEPQVLPWSLAEDFAAMGLKIVKKWATEAHGEKGGTDAIYNVAFDFSKPANEHDGFLSFHAVKPA